MATRIQMKRGTAAAWAAANPILSDGEIGFETDTSKIKIGNGTSTWTALNYFPADWTSITSKPAVIASGATQLEARTAIGLSNVDNTADADKNVLSASKLTTARNINEVAFDGTANITIPTGISRSMQTINTQTTLASAANTDYVYFLGNSTNAVNAVSFVNSGSGQGTWGGGGSYWTGQFSFSTAAANLVVFGIYVYTGWVAQGPGTSVTVNRNSVSLGTAAQSRIIGPTNGAGSGNGAVFMWAVSGSFSGTQTFDIGMQMNNGNYGGWGAIAATYNLATALGTSAAAPHTGSTTLTVNNASNIAVFTAGNSNLTATGTSSLGSFTQRNVLTSVSSGGNFYLHDIVDYSNSNKTLTAAGSAIVAQPIINSNGAPAITLPSASGNTNRYSIKNTSWYNAVVSTTGSQTIDGNTNFSLPINDCLEVVSDSSNWRIV